MNRILAMKDGNFSGCSTDPMSKREDSLSPRAFRAVADVFGEPCLLVDARGVVREANGAARAELDGLLTGPPCPLTSLFTDSPDRIVALLREGSRSARPIPGGLTLRDGPDRTGAKVRCFLGRLADGSPGLILRFSRSMPMVERFAAFSREVERGRRLAYELRRDQGLMGERMRKVEQAALTDPLTGLGNRAALERTLEALEHLPGGRDRRGQARRAEVSGTDFVAVVLDMDGLKAINDTRGHLDGDRVLALLAQALLTRLRGSDKCFRVGGDEFVIVARADPIPYRQRLATLAEEVEGAMALGGFPEAGLSWGLASRREVESPEALIALADSRMYEQKRNKPTRRRTKTVAGP
jgi:diguanylate cyclase (GGDEF)-like protein